MAQSLSAPNCSQSIFLSDERGERQHPVICCRATAGNSKSPAQSHPCFEMARGGVWWDGRGKVVDSIGASPLRAHSHTHMTYTAVDSTTWEYTTLWSISFSLLCRSSKWINKMVLQNISSISTLFLIVTLKAEASTTFGTKIPQRTCCSVLWEWMSSVFWDAQHCKIKFMASCSSFLRNSFSLFRTQKIDCVPQSGHGLRSSDKIGHKKFKSNN